MVSMTLPGVMSIKRRLYLQVQTAIYTAYMCNFVVPNNAGKILWRAVWRILLFLGFGGLLLLMSYFFPRLWNPDAEPDGEEGG